MSAMRLTYLGLAIIGAIVPMFYFVSWFNAFGWSLGAMVEAWNVNAATTGLVWDLTIAAVAADGVDRRRAPCVRRDWLASGRDPGDLLHRGELRAAAVSCSCAAVSAPRPRPE